MLLKGEGFQVHRSRPGRRAWPRSLKPISTRTLIDLNYARDTTSGQGTSSCLQRLQSEDATLPVIVLTAWASVDVAVEATAARRLRLHEALA